MPSPLRSPRLRRIIAAYTVNRLGTWFGLLALVVAVYDRTHSALAVAALLFAGQALPALVVPAVVARVEASRRSSELARLYWFEAGATACLAVLVSHFWLPLVLLVVALDGTAALAASALLRAEAARAARDQLRGETQGSPDPEAQAHDVPAHDRAASASGADAEDAGLQAERKANAALNVSFSTTFVIGPVLGGALVAAAGPASALLIDVGSFLVGGALLVGLQAHVEEIAGDSVRERLRAAWRHVNQVPSLHRFMVVETAALVFIESGGPIEVTFVKGTLGAGDSGLGLLLAMWGAGSVLGSLVFARLLRRSLATLLSAGTLAIGAAYLGLAAAPSLSLACLAGLVGGVGNGLHWPSLISIVQRISPPHLHGRLLGAVEALGSLCLAIGLSLGGVLAALSSPRAAFVVVGAGAVGVTVALLRLARVSLRGAPAAAHGVAAAAAQSPGGALGESIPHEMAPR